MQLPKNIRQIATPDEKNRIYIEDYVSTYLHRLARMDIKLYLSMYRKY